MPIFLFWTIAEVLIFAAFADHYGFLVTLGGYCLPTLMGLVLLNHFRIQGLAALQITLSQGQEPTQALLRTAAKTIGAMLLIPPSFFLRLVGFFLVIPGVSHLLIFFIKLTILKRLMSFGSGFVKAGSGGFAFYSATRNSNGSWVNRGGLDGNESSWSHGQNGSNRDVDAIDITPISIDHRQTLSKDSGRDKTQIAIFHYHCFWLSLAF